MFTISKLLTPYNFTKNGNLGRIKWIVIHYYGALGTAEENAKYYASRYIGASAHYFTDEKQTIYHSVDDADVAWHCGTTGVYYHPTCRNSNSIGIEMRPCKMNVDTMYASDNDWYFDKATVDRTVELVKWLMEKYNIDAAHVVRHYDVTHKLCPRPFVGDDINRFTGESGNKAWADFKARLTNKEEEEMDRFKTINDIPAAYRPEIQEIISAGFIKGKGDGTILDMTEDMVRNAIWSWRMYKSSINQMRQCGLTAGYTNTD